MVITILEANVSQGQWPVLEREYRAEIGGSLDAGLVQTFLLHGLADPTLWRIVTVWESREALDKMRASGETPRGVVIFQAAGAKPSLSIWDVPAYASASLPA